MAARACAVRPARRRSGAAPWLRRAEVGGGGVGLRPTGAAPPLGPVSWRLGGPVGRSLWGLCGAISSSDASGGRCGLRLCALRSRAQKPAALPQGPGARERRGEAWAGCEGEPCEAGGLAAPSFSSVPALPQEGRRTPSTCWTWPSTPRAGRGGRRSLPPAPGRVPRSTTWPRSW